MREISETVSSQILGSRLVRSELQKLEDRLQVSQQKRDELERENEELKKYKTYYELQFNMQNGKTLDGPKS